MVPSSQLHILRTIQGDNDNNNSYHTYYYYHHYYCDDCAGRVAYSTIHLPTAFLRRKTESTRRKPEGPAEEILPSQNIIIIITAKFPKVVVRRVFYIPPGYRRNHEGSACVLFVLVLFFSSVIIYSQTFRCRQNYIIFYRSSPLEYGQHAALAHITIVCR